MRQKHGGAASMGCMQKSWGGLSCLKIGGVGEGGGAQITGRWSFALFTVGPDGEFQHIHGEALSLVP